MRERKFCKPAKIGTPANNACENSPCACDRVYRDSKECVRDAADELLEALKEAVEPFSHISDENLLLNWQRKARKAIAKAEGKA